MPDMMAHARGIAQQIASIRDKARTLTSHWPTDGAHREEILRELLRERLPSRCRVESGFVITQAEQSRQIDILIIDSHKPIVARGADGTVFVTPDSVLGMAEVKSKLSGTKEYESALLQLAKSVALCAGRSVWTGLFVHEAGQQMSFWDGPDDTILYTLNSVSQTTKVRICSVCVGSHLFIRFWENSAIQAEGICDGAAWHSYFMIDLAPAYFIANFVAELTDLPEEFSRVWFPIPDGKETMRRWYAGVNDRPQLFPEYEKSSILNGIRDVIARAQKWNN
jgi:hypothetical protein